MDTTYSLGLTDWECIFAKWAIGPGQTEREKCENAERAIKQAVSNSHSLSAKSIEVFPQGSYRNRTNVKAESDVDICALCTDAFFCELPPSVSLEKFGIVGTAYGFHQYKADVEAALVSQFGRQTVKKGNKAFHINENSYRIDADVVACFQYRLYYFDANRQLRYHSGTAFLTDQEGIRVSNFPKQHYTNGVAKHEATATRFKKCVRILKRLQSHMEEVGIHAAKDVPSFLLESLIWNVPNEAFGHAKYIDDIRYILAHIWNETRDDLSCAGWTEVNAIKPLFNGFQQWTRQQAHAFVDAAWNHLGYQ